MGWFASSYGLAIVGYLFVNALAARVLGPESFGAFVTIHTAALVVGQGALLGVHRTGLREAARVKTHSDPALLQLKHDATIVGRLLLPAAGVVSAAVTWLVLDEAPVRRALIASCVAALVILAGHQKLWANYLRGFGHVRLAGLLEGRSGGPLIAAGQGAALGVVAWMSPSDERALSYALLALVIGGIAPVVLGARIARRYLSVAPSDRRWRRQLTTIARRDWKFFLLTTATALSQAVELWLAMLILGEVEGSEFAAAQRLALLIIFPLMSMQVVFSPALARMWSRGERERMQSLARTGATLAAIAATIIWVPMLVLPGAVLEAVYTEEFRTAALVLTILSVGAMCNVLSGLCGAVLSMSGHEGAPAMVMIVTLGGRLLVGAALASAFGLNGLAVGSAALSFVSNVALWAYALRVLGINTLPTLRPRLQLLRHTRG